jgi:tetratricopeptide (TPR) repeat protein
MGMPYEISVTIHRSGNPDGGMRKAMRSLRSVFFRKKERRPPSKAVSHGRNAISLYGKGRYEEAIAECDKSISVGKGNSVTYGMRAYSYIALKRHDLAIPDLEKATGLCSLEKEDERVAIVDSYYWLGVCHLRLGSYEKAAECANRMVEVAKGNRVVCGARDKIMLAIEKEKAAKRNG